MEEVEKEEEHVEFPKRKTFTKPKTLVEAPVAPLPVPPKEKEEEADAEERESFCNTFMLAFWGVLIIMLMTSLVTLHFSEPILQRVRGTYQPSAEWQVHTIHPNQINTVSAEALSNTTTPEEMWRVRRALAIHLAAYPGRYPCLCMHHLMHVNNMTMVRACATYNPKTLSLEFMLNPRLIGWDKGRGVQQVLEKSIACSMPATAQRANMAFVEWEDHESITNYMGFKGPTSYCLQLAMEEFKGTSHCSEKDPIKHLIKRKGF